jgi:hypothetical protein
LGCGDERTYHSGGDSEEDLEEGDKGDEVEGAVEEGARKARFYVGAGKDRVVWWWGGAGVGVIVLVEVGRGVFLDGRGGCL